MESKVMMTNGQIQKHRMRSIVDKVREIRVRFPQNLSKHLNCVNDCNYTQLLVQNYSNFKQSGRPDRFMYYEDGSWQDFSCEVLDAVRLGFLERKPVIEVEIGCSKSLLDFNRMMLVDFESGNRKSVAWIDADGKCFFPKTFISGGAKTLQIEIANFAENLSHEVPKIEPGITLGENCSSSKRKRENLESETEGSSSKNQVEESKKRQQLVSASKSPTWPKAKLLKEGEKTYTEVKRVFLSGLGFVEGGGATVTAIHQCLRSGPLDSARYEIFQKQLEIKKTVRGGEANMTFAWHGTSRKGVESILNHGFGMPSKIPCSEAHGIGIYLSPARSSNMSAMLSQVNDNGEKHALLCRVILGKCEKVEAGSQQSYPSSVNFDTGVDNVQNPKWYVVWCANMNTHILPECIVSYKSSNQVPGHLIGLPIVRRMPNESSSLPAKLFSKLERHLPPSKVQELRILRGKYKDGKEAKDTFLRKLRLLAGDEILCSIIREVRG